MIKMKKMFKYIMTVAAATAMTVSLSSCKNEDDLDMGAQGNYAVELTDVNAPDMEATAKTALVDFLRTSVIDAMDKGIYPQETKMKEDKKTPLPEDQQDPQWRNENLTKIKNTLYPNLVFLRQINETQAEDYLNFAVETTYIELNAAANADIRKTVPDNTVITFTLYRVVGDITVKGLPALDKDNKPLEVQKLNAGKATVTVTKDKLTIAIVK